MPVASLLDQVAPHLFLVSINGADSHLPTPDMARLIQPLNQGSYDVASLLKKLNEIGYKGPVGLPCYNIKGDTKELLAGSMATWRKLSQPTR